VRKYLIPDANDEIRQEQMREMELLSTHSGGDENEDEAIEAVNDLAQTKCNSEVISS